MRTSILSRAVVAMASLAVGSAALAATPATAATSSGITRDQVLTATNGVRTTPVEDPYSPATAAALQSMIVAQCSFAAGETLDEYYGTATQPGSSADGLLVTAVILDGGTVRICEFGAVAPADPTFALSGAATISGQMVNASGGSSTLKTMSTSMLGDVAVTAPLNSRLDGEYSASTSFLAFGASTKTTSSKVVKKVKDKKSRSEKKAAKKKYDKRLKALKKSYGKALKKAGKSPSKKSTAKRAYSTKRKAAKTTYRYEIAGYKVVRSTMLQTDRRPFDLRASDS